MNHANYMNWLQEKLISNLESKSVVVFDNESYHNVQLNLHPTTPNQQCQKRWNAVWLDERGIRYSFDMTKAKLYDLIKIHKPQFDFCNWSIVRRTWTNSAQSASLQSWCKPHRIGDIVKTRIAAKNVILSCEVFSNWQSRTLPL